MRSTARENGVEVEECSAVCEIMKMAFVLGSEWRSVWKVLARVECNRGFE